MSIAQSDISGMELCFALPKIYEQVGVVELRFKVKS